MEPEERWWRTVVETAAMVPPFGAFLWACYAGLMAWIVLAADDIPQCSVEPNRVLLVLVTVAITVMALASLVLAVRRRAFIAYACVLSEVPLAFAWMAADAGAAGCLVG